MLPGGRVRRGEDPVVTARREMNQELAVSCRGWQLTGCSAAREGYWRRTPTESFRRHTTFFLHCELETPEINPRRGELAEAAWFAVGAFPVDRSESLDLASSAGWLEFGGRSRR
jgi:8-oxo-dGTP pyrophosphatase MutT (NUDIX family)